MRRSGFALPFALVLAATPLAAQEGEGGDARSETFMEEERAPDDASGFVLSYGAALVSQYVSDGTPQSDGKPAFQPYVEASYGMFYGGLWASNVDFGEGEDDQVEFDIYAGVRREFGAVSLDVNYTRYIYDNSGDCCGEFAFIAGYAVNDAFDVSGEFDWDPEVDSTWTEVGANFGFADVWSVGSTLGTDFGSDDLGDKDKVAMTASLARAIGDVAWAEVAYMDSNYDPESVVFTLGVDF